MLRLIPILLTAVLILLAGSCRHTPDGPAPDNFSVRGIDVSHHNGEIDFDRVAADGCDFVIVKASDGTDVRSNKLNQFYARARRAGLKVGIYHYFQFRTPPDLQALNFVDAARHRPTDFPLIIDFETDDYNNSKALPTAVVVNRLDSCISLIRERGYSVMLYTNKDCYRRYIDGRFDSVPLWICSLSGGVPVDIPWTLWQYSHRGRVDGISGDVDLDVFVGDSADFAEFIGGESNKKPRLPLRQ